MNLSLRKAGGNAISLLTSDVMNRASTFVLYALVGRHLGAYEFGQLTLALTLFYTFQVFAIAGLKILITRQVAKDPSQTGKYFTNGCAIVAVFSICSIATLLAVVRLINYSRATALVTLLLSLGLFPYAFSAICEGIFQAWERMRYIPFVNVPISVSKITCAFVLLSRGYGLYAVVLILLFSQFAIAGVEGWILLRQFPRNHSPIDLPFSFAMIRSGSTFLGIDGILAATGSVNVILLSKVTNETQTGLYSAAMQLMAPLLLVYQSIALSVFPAMCQRVNPGFQSVRRIAESVIELLLIVALPIVAGLFFMGDWALSLIYKSPVFLQAFTALRIIVWILILQAFTSVLGQVLIASHREKINLRIVVVNTLVNLLIAWPLISRFGLCGAALTVLVTKVADWCQHYISVSRLFSGLAIGKITWKPIAAASCMALYLAVATGRPPFLIGVSSILVYSAALLTLVIWVSGGPREFKLKGFPLFSK